MLRNYFKIALRNLRKHKVSTIINVGGLALGIACCVLLFLFVRHEWTYDRFHEEADRIYRIVTADKQPSGAWEKRAGTPFVLGAALEETFPEVNEVVRLQNATLEVVRGETAPEQKVLFADSTLFEVFTFPLTAGSAQAALDDPNSIILTEEAARTYFGNENAMGQRLSIEFGDEARDFLVTGVARNVPATSSISFDVIVPLANFKYTFPETFRSLIMQSWSAPLSRTYALLSRPEQAADLEAKLPGFVAQHYGDEAGGKRLQLQPLTAVHLSPEVRGGLTPASNPMYSYILAGIALLVLGIACINFMTLSLGRSAGRALEVGIRKTVGAQREQVAFQFWGEALLTSTFALLLGVMLARLFLPAFSRLAEVELEFDLLGAPEGWLALAGLALVVGLIAGGYPALVLSGFRPTEVLKGLKGTARLGGRRWLTRGLVVVQFAISMALVAGVFIMSEQLQYLSEKALGFNEEQVIVIDPEMSSEEGERIYEPFRNEIARYGGVRAVTSSFFTVGSESGLSTALQGGDTTQVRAYVNPVDDNFLEAMQIDLLVGRDLFAAQVTDNRKEVLVNEALVRTLGWVPVEAAVGKELPIAEGGTFSESFSGMTVVGVVEDFHFQSLHQEIAPLILAPRAAMGGGVMNIFMRVAPEDIPQTLARLEAVWQEVAPGAPFAYEFLDEVINQQYRAEERWRAIVGYASGFALVIACFGLFGLAALAAQRRTKEIGIRKVLGASVPSIVGLLSKDFLKLVVIAFVIAVPAAYYAMSRWLEEFAYRIELGPWIFVGAGVLVLLVALATVSYQAVRAALANPVEALRSE